MTDYHYTWLQEMATRIAELIPDLSGRCHVQKLPVYRRLTHGDYGALVWPLTSRVFTQTNYSDRWSLANGLTFYWRGKQHLTANLPVLLYWRQQMFGWHNQPATFSNVDEAFRLLVAPRQALDPTDWVRSMDTTKLIVTADYRVRRTP